MANKPSRAKVDDDAAYQPVCGAGGEPGGTLEPSSKMTITRSMRNSIRECSLPVCNVCAISPFLALRLGDLARAAGLRAGDLALAAGFRAGDLARPRGFGAGEAALALRVATMVDATRRRRMEAAESAALGVVVPRRAPLCKLVSRNQ